MHTTILHQLQRLLSAECDERIINDSKLKDNEEKAVVAYFKVGPAIFTFA
jgi:hypothetical protein